MSILTLHYPVYTLDNQQLFPAGAIVSSESLDVLISSNMNASHQTSPLLCYGSCKKDLLHFLSQPPYQTIFYDQKQVSDIVNLMENINVIQPVLYSIEYFRQYDFYTYRHFLMVSALSTLLAKCLLPDYDDLASESLAAPVHDFGKICIPLNILKKNTPLTRNERKILEHHTTAGYVLLTYYLKTYQNFSVIAARDHHERRDGSGYPVGRLLTDSMIEIIAICDIFDALVSPRPYRCVSYDTRTALEEITTMAEIGKFGWDALKVLVSYNRKYRPHFSECSVSIEKRGVQPPNNLYNVIADE